MTTMAQHAKHQQQQQQQQQATQTQHHHHQRQQQTQTHHPNHQQREGPNGELKRPEMTSKQTNVSTSSQKQSNSTRTSDTLANGGAQVQVKHPIESKATTTTQANNANRLQQSQSEQDGKRTLIKNQLYLIEQLQLENANLRNERDQLQLENEELKFQLQMISSSNILSQPGATFNNRQLEKLVEHDDKINGHTPTSTTNAASSSLPTTSQQPPGAGSSGGGGGGGNQVKSNFATPVGQPMRLNGDNHRVTQIIPNATTTVSGAISLDSKPSASVRQSTVSAAATIVPIGGQAGDGNNANNKRSANPTDGKLSSGGGGGGSATSGGKLASSLSNFSANGGAVGQATGDSVTHSAADLELPSVARTSNSANTISTPVDDTLDHNPSPASSSSAASMLLQDEDDQQQERRVKLVEQLYGDRDEVQAAAIIIQRAFRKHQICKRFRTITEQLRHTCNLTANNSSQLTTATSVDNNGRLAPKLSSSSATVGQKSQSSTSTSSQLSSSSSFLSSTNSSASTATTSSSKLSDIQYAVGATRAAAWESLSQAANRLAASAAAATSGLANKQQAATTSSNRSTNSSHQQTINSNSSSQVASQTPMTSIITPQHQPHHQNGRLLQQSNQQTKQQDAVVAAAINFQQLESIRKRQYRVGLNIFNKHPEKGVSFLVAHSFIDASSPYSKSSTSYYQSNQLYLMDEKQMSGGIQNAGSQNQQQKTLNCHLCHEEENLKRNVAHFLLHRKGLAKEKIGQYLGNLQEPFNQDVLRFYLQELDFNGLQIDIALRKFSSTFRLPGEAQKIERIVDCFAQRYVQCQQQQPQAPNGTTSSQQNVNQANQQTPAHQPQMGNSNYKNNLMLLSKDEIFILTFAIIMLNTDLHSPSLKPTSRMSGAQFINNLRGVFKSQTITESDLLEIYERVKANQITTAPDHVTHVMKVQQGLTVTNFQKKELPNLCVPHRRLVCFCRLFEVYDLNKKERVGQHQREIFLFNDMLLVTKLARRVRANAIQLYTYRQSIPLQGLHVQLFQSTHYQYGIRLCQRSSDETLIMFNARNEMDQSRFVDDLSESIAEMDEMAAIKANNVIDTIHFKYQDRLRRHSMLHSNNENIPPQQIVAAELVEEDVGAESSIAANICDINNYNRKAKDNNNRYQQKEVDMQFVSGARSSLLASGLEQSRRVRSKFSSMSNLSSVAESRDDDTAVTGNSASGSPTRPAGGLRQNQSFVQQQADRSGISDESHSSDQTSSSQRRSSSNSVHSLDSGLFLSRDVSPNQSS